MDKPRITLSDSQYDYANKAALGDSGRTLGMLALGTLLEGEGIGFIQVLIRLEHSAQLLIEENGEHIVLTCQARTPHDMGTTLRVIHPIGREGHPYDAAEWIHVGARRIDTGEIELLGWCSGRDMQRVDGSYQQTDVHHNNLLPLSRLLHALKEKKLIDQLQMQRADQLQRGSFPT